MKKIISLILFVFFASCAWGVPNKPEAYILKYEDFGPPAMSNDLLGMDWWQWQDHGDSSPQQYDIKVVVYRAIRLQDVKEQYPVIPIKKLDYRYLEYRDALRYLDAHIDENAIEIITNKLVTTRKIIINRFGGK